MTRRLAARPVARLLLLVVLAACSKAPDSAGQPAANATTAVTAPAPPSAPILPTPALPPQPPGDDPATFLPLASDAVKDAIHRALATGATQRWQDGKLSGYAVPSTTTGANGCRAVRYTVDQRPGHVDTITACDAGH